MGNCQKNSKRKIREIEKLSASIFQDCNANMAANLCRQFVLRNTLSLSRSVGGASIHTSKALTSKDQTLAVTDQETHTGQQWDVDDVRSARFMGGKQKQTNQRWAMDLINEVPVIK